MNIFIGVVILLTLFIFLPLFIVIYLAHYFFKPSIERNSNYSKFKDEEKKAGIEERTEDQPTIVRDLTVEEKAQLEEDRIFTKWSSDHIWLFPLTIVLDGLLIGLFIYIGNSVWFRPQDIQGFVSTPLMALVGFQVLLLVFSLKDRPLYFDLRSPVFRIKGKVIKETKVYEDKERNKFVSYFVYVNDIGFTFNEDSKYKRLYDQLNDGDKVAIEYSPRTKRAWNFYKV